MTRTRLDHPFGLIPIRRVYGKQLLPLFPVLILDRHRDRGPHVRYQKAPGRYEAGTGNIADAVGLGAAIDYVMKLGIEFIEQYEHFLLQYAIEKLKLATTLKGFKDPETYTILGDAYRKFADGGNALTAYQSALSIDPKYARAPYRIGKIYQTQGSSQVDIFMQYYNQAISLDANYTPVYYALYDYYYKTNVVKSAEYLEKYLSLMGSDEPQAWKERSAAAQSLLTVL